MRHRGGAEMRCGNFFVNMSMDVLSSRRASCFETSSDKSCANSSPVQCVPADGMPCTHHGVGLEKAETRRKGCERPGSGTQGADDCTSTHNSYTHTHVHNTHTCSRPSSLLFSLPLTPPSHPQTLLLTSSVTLSPPHKHSNDPRHTRTPARECVCVVCVCVCVVCVCVCVCA